MAAKKQAGSGPKPPKSVPHKDHYARISYLYQAAGHFAGSEKYGILSRALARNVDLVSKKTVLKLTPALKRTLCKRCNSLLVAGLTMAVSIENKAKNQQDVNDVLVHSCTRCGTVKRFPVGRNRDYVLFSEDPDVKIDVK